MINDISTYMMSRFDSTLRRNGHNSFRNRRDVCWDNLRCIPFLSRIFNFFHKKEQTKVLYCNLNKHHIKI